MSPRCLSICLLVLLGAAVTSGAALQFLSEPLKRHHDVVAEALELTQPDVIGEPLFNAVISSSNSSCPRRDDVQLMSAALDIYAHVFSNILEKKQNLLEQVSLARQPAVEAALKHLQSKMKELKKNLSQMNQKREEVMAKLKTMEVTDVRVQKKALAQFKAVYQAASLIGHCGHAHSQ